MLFPAMFHRSFLRARAPAVLALALTCALIAPLTAKTLEIGLAALFPTERQVKTLQVVNKVLERFHYREFAVSADFARQVFENYFKDLDPSRAFFLARDRERFLSETAKLDTALRQGKVDLAFELFRLYRMRVENRIDHALRLLDGKFSFERNEQYRFERGNAPWAEDEAELNEIWRQRVKNDYLTLKLADKSDAEIRAQLRKRYQGIVQRVRQFNNEDVFQTFANAYTRTLEPHTAYMSPSLSENFDISMSLSLEGIGAVLAVDGDYTAIQRTIPGGPARQSGQIHAGDRILAVAQGVDGDMEDVVGWRLQDVVDRIRGPKGSVVRLHLLPKTDATGGGRMREVILVRNEIALKDQAAKARVLAAPDNAPELRMGVLEVPAFYRDFRAEAKGARDFRSTTRDVRRLVSELNRQGIDGLVIDLRGNGGGSLTEATSLTGLFITEGPVVQVKDAFGKVEVENDPDPQIVYDGPLAVIVDRNSASAAEIFVGAIQDYGRGIVVGEPTFGKGTVQTLIDLNRYVSGNEGDLGRLRLTMAEFFRISGGSTQLKGVEPDLFFDLGFDAAKHGERALDNPLPWSRIRAANYSRYSEIDVAPLRARSAQRTAQDDGFRLLAAQGRLLRQIEDQQTVSLRERDRRLEAERRDRVLKEEKRRFLRARGIELVEDDDDSRPLDEEALERQQKAIDAIQIDEAARILADLIHDRRAAR